MVHNPEDEPVVEQAKTAGPPLPYRANRTGLRTDKLPPPPLHRAIEGGTAQETGIIQGTTKAKPSLPPRLPPRRNSSNLTSPVTSSPPPPTYDSIVEEPKSAGSTYLSQGAVDRLGKAGISVPGLGIGQSTGAVPIDQSQSKTSPSSQLQGIQNRFSRMNSSPTSTSPPPISPPQGTTLAQKQSALRAAQAFHKDPSSVSLADAQSAASTANNFRERHQEQITAGAQKANSWNKKYNITGKVNSFLEQQASPAQQSTQQQALQEAAPQSPRNASQAVLTPDLSNRKPPPPPPPKKPSGMHGQGMGGQTPPPVPLGTKPSFG